MSKPEGDLRRLLQNMTPVRRTGSWYFCTTPEREILHRVSPVVSVDEAEGLTLILESADAEREAIASEGPFAMITLNVHSSLAAVGLTAAVATRLATRGIPANIVAGFHHDHIFVPEGRIDDALEALELLSAEARESPRDD